MPDVTVEASGDQLLVFVLRDRVGKEFFEGQDGADPDEQSKDDQNGSNGKHCIPVIDPAEFGRGSREAKKISDRDG